MPGSEERRGLSVSQLQQLVTRAVAETPALQNVWVRAELIDVRLSGGHLYMELLEKDELTGELRGKIKGMIWASRLGAIRHKFIGGTGADIVSGLKVMVRGSVNHHGLHGLGFVITDIDPTFTIGDLERQRREILMRLHQEGKIDLNKRFQSTFPATPQRIAIISAPGAAGYGDFMNHLTGSPEKIVFYPLLYPAVMQGEKTAASVIAALDRVEMATDFWDCVVIIRGGGATTDLNGFDNYELALRVAECPIPVIVGIGHERDRTVLDEIACIRCKTPTAVADFLVDRCRKAWSVTGDRAIRIAQFAEERLKGEKMRLENVESLLPARVSAAVMKASNHLAEIHHSIDRSLSRRLARENSGLDIIRVRLENALKGVTEKPSLKLKSLEDMLRVLCPENTLKRGYSITRVNGHAIYDANMLKEGDSIETVFATGKVKSEVKSIIGERQRSELIWKQNLLKK